MALYLADTSAWQRSGRADPRWSALMEAGVVAVCSPVALELLFSARDRADYERLASDLARLPSLSLDHRAASAATRTQRRLAARAQHRGPKPIDLLIAGIAEVHDAILLHYDRHFDAIAGVTGQPCEWLAERGRLA